MRPTTPRRGQWPYAQSAHLLADSVAELHVFAERLGMRRAWFQQGGTAPHYDLSPVRHARALELGATLLDRAALGRLLRQLRTAT